MASLGSKFGVTGIGSNFGHHVALLALVVNLVLLVVLVNVANSWCFLPDGATCINSNIGHQVVPLALPHCL